MRPQKRCIKRHIKRCQKASNEIASESESLRLLLMTSSSMQETTSKRPLIAEFICSNLLRESAILFQNVSTRSCETLLPINKRTQKGGRPGLMVNGGNS